MTYVQFPQSFANEIKMRLREASAAIKESMVYDKGLTVEQWSNLNTILVRIEVGLRSEEEHREAMRRYEEKV